MQGSLVALTAADFVGWQAGAIVMTTGAIKGVQTGLFNQAASVTGVQIGVVNMTTDMNGIQIGLANMIKNGPLPFCVLANGQF